jgi:hypothetical protein
VQDLRAWSPGANNDVWNSFAVLLGILFCAAGVLTLPNIFLTVAFLAAGIGLIGRRHVLQCTSCGVIFAAR